MRRFKFLILIFTLCALVVGPSLARPIDWTNDYDTRPSKWGPNAHSPVFDKAKYYSENSFFDQALEEFERVLAENIGTDIEPTARLLLANEYAHTHTHRPKNEAYKASLVQKFRDQLAQVIQRFPGTTYSFVAKALIFEMLNENEDPTAFDQELGALGAPPIADILANGPSTPYHERLLPLEYRPLVAEVYYRANNFVSSADEAKLQLFLADSFPESNWLGGGLGYFRGPLRIPAGTIDGPIPGRPTEPDSTAPIFLARSPEPNSTTDPFPHISIILTDGDHWQRQISMKHTRMLLDGVDVTEKTFWESEVNRNGTPYFRKAKLFYTPITPLTAGSHVVEVIAKDTPFPDDEGNMATYRWSFTVTNQSPQPTTQTLPATKDALIDNFDPNGNEGSNSILALDKLLGRGSRSLVGFDLSGVDTNRLSKATLVLSIHKDEKIFGCGAGEQVSVQALTNTWVEGNGKSYKVLPLTARRRGSGAGATWNRDTDSNIANILANGGYAWNGAQSATMPRTAPMMMARDDMQGTLQFDVTQDVLNGAPHGWLIRKQHENLASRISFYSKEGAVAAGNTDLAPKLVLEYDGPTASLHPGVAKVASFLGLPTPKADSKPIQLREVVASSERPTLKNALQNHPTASLIGERLASTLLSHQPLLELGARSAYRSWLREEAVIGIANLPSRA